MKIIKSKEKVRMEWEKKVATTTKLITRE